MRYTNVCFLLYGRKAYAKLCDILLSLSLVYICITHNARIYVTELYSRPGNNRIKINSRLACHLAISAHAGNPPRHHTAMALFGFQSANWVITLGPNWCILYAYDTGISRAIRHERRPNYSRNWLTTPLRTGEGVILIGWPMKQTNKQKNARATDVENKIRGFPLKPMRRAGACVLLCRDRTVINERPFGWLIFWVQLAAVNACALWNGRWLRSQINSNTRQRHSKIFITGRGETCGLSDRKSSVIYEVGNLGHTRSTLDR